MKRPGTDPMERICGAGLTSLRLADWLPDERWNLRGVPAERKSRLKPLFHPNKAELDDKPDV